MTGRFGVLKQQLDFERGELANITRLFCTGVLTVTKSEYENCSPFAQVALSLISEEVLRYQSKDGRE